MSRYRFVVPVLLSLGAATAPPAAFGQAIGVNITIAPPELPVYEQPPIPAPGYIWTPGYWAYGPDGYFWVPGTWVEPPEVGLLWTPGWWGWNNGLYVFNQGYWGPQVGFYGGVNYGYGYGGSGYQGGRWDHGRFAYNRAANNIGNVHITNVYNTTIINTTNRVSFNGGQGGIAARPTPQQEAFAHASHTPPTSLQVQHQQAAGGNHALLATVNNGRPPIAATSRPAAFTGPGVVPARNAAMAPHGAPGPAIAGPHGATSATPGAPPALRPPGEAGRAPAPHPQPVTPGTAPGLRPPAEGAHPAVVPHQGPETRAPAPQEHVAPAPQERPAPAPVHPQVAPPERAAPMPERAAPVPERAAPVPHPQAAPPPRPEAAPVPRPEPRPAPQREEERKPPGSPG
jgi:hypothetical protein